MFVSLTSDTLSQNAKHLLFELIMMYQKIILLADHDVPKWQEKLKVSNLKSWIRLVGDLNENY